MGKVIGLVIQTKSVQVLLTMVCLVTKPNIYKSLTTEHPIDYYEKFSRMSLCCFFFFFLNNYNL